MPPFGANSKGPPQRLMIFETSRMTRGTTQIAPLLTPLILRPDAAPFGRVLLTFRRSSLRLGSYKQGIFPRDPPSLMARTDRHFSVGARKRPLRHRLYFLPVSDSTAARFACLTFAIVCQKPRKYTKYSLRFCLPLTEVIRRASRSVLISDRLLFLNSVPHFSKIVNQLNRHPRRIF